MEIERQKGLRLLVKKKVIKRKFEFITRPISDYISKNNHRRVNKYAKYYDSLNVEQNTILYESRDGNSITDSPYAMFKYMINSSKFKSFRHVWSVADFEALSPVISKFKDMPNVEFVKRNSEKYLKYLATSKYLINNSTFQSFFTPKSNQIYINTWHGTPLKKMGFDIPGNPSHSQNVLRNFLSTDYILSPNLHTTKVFSDSYKLKGLYKGTIIEEGYPRIDLTLNTNSSAFGEYLCRLGININKNKKNILYAPTWKGTNVSKASNDLQQIIADMNYLEQNVGDEFNILIKVHPFIYKEAIKYPEMKSKLIPDYIDSNELLSVVDLLITDYSSIFFDFLVTGKPIVFYTWDADVYTEERGQYISNDKLPGPIAYNVNELADLISNINAVSDEYKDRYKEMQKDFTKYEDGNVTERVINYIFGDNKARVNVIDNLEGSKQKILIYPGGMRDNGITSSFINLMNNIDYDKYDVSCFTATPHAREVLKNLDKVNKNVRFIFKPGLPVYKISEVYRDKFIHNRGEHGFLGKRAYPEEAYNREHKRLFGKVKFDYAIDFSGYSLYWAKFLLAADVKKKICYMHNDLLSDSERKINGKRPHRLNLRGLFSVYHRFDKLVSVSKGTMELNRKNLLCYADFNKFDFIMNSINPEKILNNDNPKRIGTHESTNDVAVTSENFKGRARVINLKDYPVLNTLPGNINFREFYLDAKFLNAEIVISRKAFVNSKTYFKFSYNNQIIGWIHGNAIKLLSDSIVLEKDVDKIAQLVNPKGNHIWSKPYKISGAYKVSNSHDFKGLIVDVDKEVMTQHSTYSRISVNNIVIGWIDSSALKHIEQYAVDCLISNKEREKIIIKRNEIKSKNYKENKLLIESIENRTLKERDINRQIYAKITMPGNHSVWTKAYPNYKVKKIANAKEFEGQITKIVRVNTTRKGTYYLFEIDNNKIGWLDEKAFKILDEPILIKEISISYQAKIKLREKDFIWNKPYGLTGAKIIKNSQSLDGSSIKVDKEVVTLKGTYSRLMQNGVPLGWLDKNALVIEEVFGLVINDEYIPYPSEKNINFVNMGRLSPEKGQDNLIRAFANFHKENKNSKLFILGQGPLKDELHDLINELKLNNYVYLLGQLENPFGFLRKCDCFVLSSHYEGQPMVLLEAMTLGMNIMATDIVANRTVLEDGKYGLLVENNITGLEKGMQLIFKGTNKVREPFNYQTYNEIAMKSFYKCLK